ncbi:HAD-IB family hydrolase [bacterium]|nr:HAD-IB family hydrolase [bacterium]
MNYKNNPKLKVAVFDLDRTLLKNRVAEILLAKFLIRKKMISCKNVLEMFVYMFRNIKHGIKESVFRNRIYIKGIKEKDLMSILPEFRKRELLPKLSVRIVEQVKLLKERGFYIILLSGSIDFLLEMIKDYVGADLAIGAKHEVVNGEFTGRLVFHPYFRDKWYIFDDIFKNIEIDLPNSYMFADSITDIPLIKRCGHPVVVDPGFFMHIYALLKGWKILKHD